MSCDPDEVLLHKREGNITWLLDIYTAVKFFILGIAFQALLDAIANKLFERNSINNVFYWLGILCTLWLIFTISSVVLRFLQDWAYRPVAEDMRLHPHPVNVKATVPIDELDSVKAVQAEEYVSQQALAVRAKREHQVAVLRDTYKAARLFVVGISVQSLLQALANFAFPNEETYIVVFWLAIFVVMTVVFWLLNAVLLRFKHRVMDPLEARIRQRHWRQRSKMTVPLRSVLNQQNQ